MRTFIFLPPLKKHAGGVAVLIRMARLLQDAGFPTVLVPREGEGPFEEAPGVPVTSMDRADPGPADIWLVPEGWANALAPGLSRGARCVVYVQNAAYLLSSLPEGVDWSRLPVHFLSVSQPTQWYVRMAAGRDAPVLRPGIDLSRFTPPQNWPASGLPDPDAAVRIAWMPRKNRAQAEQIRQVVESRLACGTAAAEARGPLEWQPLHGLAPEEVPARLRSAHIFLVTGFPEGCPLPPLEAMACGCLPVGFTGFGGWDYKRQLLPASEGGSVPWWPADTETDSAAPFGAELAGQEAGAGGGLPGVHGEAPDAGDALGASDDTFGDALGDAACKPSVRSGSSDLSASDARPCPHGADPMPGSPSADQSPLAGNGFWVADADVMAAALAVEKAVSLWRTGSPVLEMMLQSGRKTAARYGLDAQRRRLVHLWGMAREDRLFR